MKAITSPSADLGRGWGLEAVVSAVLVGAGDSGLRDVRCPRSQLRRHRVSTAAIGWACQSDRVAAWEGREAGENLAHRLAWNAVIRPGNGRPGRLTEMPRSIQTQQPCRRQEACRHGES